MRFGWLVLCSVWFCAIAAAGEPATRFDRVLGDVRATLRTRFSWRAQRALHGALRRLASLEANGASAARVYDERTGRWKDVSMTVAEQPGRTIAHILETHGGLDQGGTRVIAIETLDREGDRVQRVHQTWIEGGGRWLQQNDTRLIREGGRARVQSRIHNERGWLASLLREERDVETYTRDGKGMILRDRLKLVLAGLPIWIRSAVPAPYREGDALPVRTLLPR
jgi:hypothetical protein